MTQNYRVLVKIASCHYGNWLFNLLRGLRVKTKLSIKSRRNLKLASVISMSAFSLVAGVTAAFAWFANNKKTNGDGIHGDVQEPEGAFSALTLHRCITNESTDTELKFYPEDSGAEAINLDYYSELNTSQPVLLLFKLQPGGVQGSDVHLSVQTTLEDPQPYSIVNNDTPSAPNYYDSFSLTSAIQFRVLAFTSTDYDTSDPEADDPFEYTLDISGTTKQAFVEVSNNQLIWSHKTNGVNDAGFDLYNGTGTTPITYLALIMDYNSTAINFIYDHNTSNEHDIKFKCDFTFTIS